MNQSNMLFGMLRTSERFQFRNPYVIVNSASNEKISSNSYRAALGKEHSTSSVAGVKVVL
jgi:hypothetical protein